MKTSRWIRPVGISFTILLSVFVFQFSRPAHGQSFHSAENPSAADWSQIQGALYYELTKISDSELNEEDLFGFSTAISGDTIVVGEPQEIMTPGDPQDDAGAAYVFQRNHGGPDNWGLVKKLVASDGGVGDLFGISVDIDGDTIVVGGDQNHDNSPDSPLAGGAVYVFERDFGGKNNWGESARLVASGVEEPGKFGRGVGISGNTIVASNRGDDLFGLYEGAVYVFERDAGGPGAWGQTARLTSSDTGEEDGFGGGLAVDGNLILVGAPLNGVVDFETGAVYVFERSMANPGDWIEVGQLLPVDGGTFDHFGEVIAIEGETAVVGAYSNDGLVGNLQIDRGAAYVFEKDQGGPDAWGLIKKITASDGETNDEFGSNVEIDEDTIVVGAPDHLVSPSPIYHAGAVYTYERDLGGPENWGESAELSASDGEGAEKFSVVAIDGEHLVIGAPHAHGGGNAIYAGAAYIFKRHQIVSRAFVPLATNCEILYADDFSNPNSGWPKVDTGSTLFEYKAGEYRILFDNKFSLAGAHPGVSFTEYLVSVSVRNLQNLPGTYGLLFGLAPEWEYFYTLEIDNAKHWELWHWWGTWELRASGTSDALKPGTASNTIAVERYFPGYFKFYANGELLTSLQDTDAPGMRNLGVWATSGSEENLDIRFDNYKVEPIGCGWSAGETQTGAETLPWEGPDSAGWIEGGFPPRDP